MTRPRAALLVATVVGVGAIAVYVMMPHAASKVTENQAGCPSGYHVGQAGTHCKHSGWSPIE